MTRSVLPGEAIVESWNDLCLFLGGSHDSFTGKLLELIAKADMTNRARLALAFPEEVAAWTLWRDESGLTVDALRKLITESIKLMAVPR